MSLTNPEVRALITANAVTSVASANSLTGGPITSTGTLQLVNDAASPGNNKVYGTNGAGTKGWQAAATGTVTSVATDSTLTGGPITSTGTLGIDLTHANTWSGVQKHTARLEEGQGASVASATSITLGSDGNQFFITGAVTIQTIVATNWQDGSEITLAFSGANGPLLKHGIGNVFLNNAVDLQITGIGFVRLRMSGGSWYQTIPFTNTSTALASSQTSPTNPAGVATAAGAVMMGLGTTATISPSRAGRVLIMISGDVGNSVIGTEKIQIRFGTGTAPANGAAVTGTALGGLVEATISAANAFLPFALQGIVSGLLNNGTTYWIDVSLQSAGVLGVATIQDLSVSAIEI